MAPYNSSGAIRDISFKKCVNNVFLNQFAISGLVETWEIQEDVGEI